MKLSLIFNPVGREMDTGLNEVSYSNKIKIDINKIISGIPPHVTLIAAVKNRSYNEVDALVNAGVKFLGYNYLQDAEKHYLFLGSRAGWHFIGHLQRNKVKRAVRLFDMIETVDSSRLADLIDRECEILDKKMPVLIEVNSGEEMQKSGVSPSQVKDLALYINDLPNLKLQGLMTMGPRFGDPELSRPYFRIAKELLEDLRNSGLSDSEFKYLSMGMSNNYRIAIEEGANIIRLGRILFEKKVIINY